MKKLVFFIVAILLVGSCGLYFYNMKFAENKSNLSSNDNEIKYPDIRSQKNSLRFYSSSMTEKYPDILDIQKKFFQYHIETPYEIKRNDKGMAGVYERESGKLIIPHQYKILNQCSSVYCMFFTAKNDFTYKVIDYKNNVIFEAPYDDMECKINYCGIKTQNDGKYGMVSYDGIEVLKPEYDSIECQEHYGEQGGWYYIAGKGNKYGVWDNKGNTVIALQDKVLSKTGVGHFFIIEDGMKKGIMDIYGNVILNPIYDSIEYKDSNYDEMKSFFVACQIEKGCGTFETSGKPVLPLKFENDIVKLNDDYYAVGKSQEAMYIVDKTGKRTTKRTFDSIWHFNDKYAFFRIYGENPGMGIIDFKGNIIMGHDFDVHNIERMTDNGLIKVMKSGKYGIVYKNKMIVPTEYEKIFFNRGHVLIKYRKDGAAYYYVASNKEMAKENLDLTSLKSYRTKTYKKIGDNCFKVTTDDGNDVTYCNEDEDTK